MTYNHKYCATCQTSGDHVVNGDGLCPACADKKGYAKEFQRLYPREAARVTELEGELMIERAVCICGCDHSDHEFLGPDDGECCGNEDHQCLRVAPGIRAMFLEQRDRADTLQAQVDKLTEALRGWVDHAQNDRVLMAHSKLMDASHKALGNVAALGKVG